MQNIAFGIKGVIPDFNRAIQFITYSSLYLSLAGGSMVFISCSLQDLAFSPAAALIVMLGTYCIYNLNRKTDEAEDMVNHHERYSFTKKYGLFLYYSSIAGYIAAIGLGLFYGPEAVFLTLFPLLAGIFYSIPIFPKKFGFSRIKEVPVFKSLIVAVSWAVPPAFLPVYLASMNPCFQTYITTLYFFILVFTSTVVFDVRDMVGDAASGVKTIPVIIGKKKTAFLLSLINAGGGTAIICSFLSNVTFIQVLFLAFSMIYVQIYIIYSLYRNTAKIVYELFIDGKFIILTGILILLLNL